MVSRKCPVDKLAEQFGELHGELGDGLCLDDLGEFDVVGGAGVGVSASR